MQSKGQAIQGQILTCANLKALFLDPIQPFPITNYNVGEMTVTRARSGNQPISQSAFQQSNPQKKFFQNPRARGDQSRVHHSAKEGKIRQPYILKTCFTFKLQQSILCFLGATKHLYNWLYPSVGRSVTHSFDDRHVAPYWPTWPCFFYAPLLRFASSSYLLSLAQFLIFYS